VAHTWSLAVEEQFYLLWPALLVVLGVRRAVWLAGAYLALAPLGRVLVWYLHPAWRDGMGHTFFTVADTISAGCLLAALTDTFWKKDWYRALLGSRWFALVPVAVLAVGALEDRPRFAFSVGAVVVNAGVALCIDRCLRFPDSVATRLLSVAPLVAIGRMSYSIYLWQQPFLNRYSAGLAASFPENLILLAVVSVVAYFAVEKPALSARAALEVWLGQLWSPRQRRSAVRLASVTPPLSRAT
jgi:peptidoglycan/LPS O-acetylase OafA/YrhL